MKFTLVQFVRMTLLAAALFVGFSASAPSADACPNCKDSLAEDSDSELARLGKGYSTSVLFMLGVMGCLVAGFGGAAYFVVKKAAAMPMPEQHPELNPQQQPGQTANGSDASDTAASRSQSSSIDDHTV